MFKRSLRGFTLIELMIGMVLSLVLLSLALPSFRALYQNAQVRSSADSVLGGLQLARSEAMKSNARIAYFTTTSLDASCTLSETGVFWVVGRDDPTGACGSQPSNSVAPRIVQSGRLSDVTGKVALEAKDPSGSGATAVSFNGSGFVTPNPDGSASIADVRLLANKLASTSRVVLRIQVAGAGRIKMCLEGDTTGGPQSCD